MAYKALNTYMINRFRTAFFAGSVVLLAALTGFSQQVRRAPFDVTKYVMDVQLVPNDRKLIATADVTFVPGEDTRSVSFELNGSLKVDQISRVNSSMLTTATPVKGKPAPAPLSAGAITFVQDQTGTSDLGPNVRIDLGENMVKGTPVTLRFKYSGVLDTPAGGPLLNKRLAYVGENQGYLMYASRWFPFHDYAADLATSDVTITVPGGFQIVGYSDSPAAATGGKAKFVQSKPGLIGNFAYGKYMAKTLRMGEYELAFYTRPGTDAAVNSFGETLGE